MRSLILLHLAGNKDALALVSELTGDMEQLDPIMSITRAIEDYRAGVYIEEATAGVVRTMDLIIKARSTAGSQKMTTVAKNVRHLVSGNVAKLKTDDEEAGRRRLDELVHLLEIVRHSLTPWMPELCLNLRTGCDCGGKMDTGDIECPSCGRVRMMCRATVEGCRAHSRARNATPTNRMTTRAERYALAMSSDSRRAISFLEMMTDENPLTMVPEIGAIASRQEQLMEMLGGIGYAPAVAKQIGRLSDKLLDEIETQDLDAVAASVKTLLALIDQLKNDAVIWDQFNSNAALMNKMVESQNKHAVAQQEMISRDQFRREKMAMIAAIREAVADGARRYVSKLREAFVIEAETPDDILSERELVKVIGTEIVSQMKRLEMATGVNDV